jgi:hypothetical protein
MKSGCSPVDKAMFPSLFPSPVAAKFFVLSRCSNFIFSRPHNLLRGPRYGKADVFRRSPMRPGDAALHFGPGPFACLPLQRGAPGSGSVATFSSTSKVRALLSHARPQRTAGGDVRLSRPQPPGGFSSKEPEQKNARSAEGLFGLSAPTGAIWVSTYIDPDWEGKVRARRKKFHSAALLCRRTFALV